MKRVATDIGGTFTDLVHFDPEAAPGSSIVCAKVDSTPPGFEHGVMNALAKTQIRGEDSVVESPPL
jgi:N-methylhydantoinase A